MMKETTGHTTRDIPPRGDARHITKNGIYGYSNQNSERGVELQSSGLSVFSSRSQTKKSSSSVLPPGPRSRNSYVDDSNFLIIVRSLPFFYRKCPNLKTSTYICTEMTYNTVFYALLRMCSAARTNVVVIVIVIDILCRDNKAEGL
jgi:hypothetical protein